MWCGMWGRQELVCVGGGVAHAPPAVAPPYWERGFRGFALYMGRRGRGVG